MNILNNLTFKFTTILFLFLITSIATRAQDIDTLNWEEIVELSDTLYMGGLDTIYVLEDSVSETEGFKTGTTGECLTIGTTISVNLNKTVKPINQEQFGVNITGMFTKATLYGDLHSADQRQWLSDLRPQTIRFPGGSSSKFMHPYTGSKGYGYDIVEITRYLDATDGDLEAPATAAAILAVTDPAIILGWFGGNTDIKGIYDGYLTDYINQELLSPGDLFIFQFVDLIEKIESENGYDVDVIICLNILTETAANCKAMVDFLISQNVNVVGVEMGNETANKFHEQIMRFNFFDDYYSYLDGIKPSGQSSLELDLGEPLFLPAADHNFFLVFKKKPGFLCKIGLCADGFNDPAEHVFITAPGETVGTRSDDSWNEDLASHRSDVFDGTTIRKYNAIIFHTYYSADSWYDEKVDPYLYNSYTAPEWDYDEMDTRLQPAFDASRVNFRRFLNVKYQNDLDDFNTIFQFNLTSLDKKELWITEWNLRDEGTDDRGKVFTNTFMHTCLLQEWWLKNLKLNFTEGFKENFFTYSTLQNYAGGSQIQLLTPADEDVELDILLKNYSPYNLASGDPAKRNYYVKRTTMYTMELLSQINKNDLRYFPANVAIYGHNPNIPPTFFIDPAKEYIYMYYTNTRCNDQKIILNPAGMYPMFLYDVELEDAHIYAVDAKQAYSTSGKCMLFEINSFYNTTDYEIEIDQTYDYANPGGDAPEGSLCVIVPGYTAGYVKIHVIPAGSGKIGKEKFTELVIYPNPSKEYIKVETNERFVGYEIYSSLGSKIYSSNNFESIIDIHKLTSGTYTIALRRIDGSQLIKSFIKAE